MKKPPPLLMKYTGYYKPSIDMSKAIYDFKNNKFNGWALKTDWTFYNQGIKDLSWWVWFKHYYRPNFPTGVFGG